MKIAVIGHGPSPVGQGWGWEIDRCDAVWRFWDCHWQDPADYGTRYDIGLFTAVPGELKFFRRHRRRDPGAWFAYDLRGLYRNGHVEPLHQPVVSFDARPWVEQARRLGGRGAGGRLELSRGCAASMMAMTAGKTDRLILVGLDAIRDGNLPADHYPEDFKACIRETGRTMNLSHLGTRTGSHDWAVERKLIEASGLAHDCAIEWR
jgi:hypothetical protein